MTAPRQGGEARRIILGTAGHVDHGKTELVRALTGRDTDRLKEEKERGISIELGFAPLELSPDIFIGIVDVPGHERFVKQMVAGAGGIDLAMLLVAADEGVMPQTQEHMEVLRCWLPGVVHHRIGIIGMHEVTHCRVDQTGSPDQECPGMHEPCFEPCHRARASPIT